MKVAFVDVLGTRTRYLRAGGPLGVRPVVLLHGFGSFADAWHRSIDILGRSRPVFAPDLLGHGYTDPLELDGSPPHGPTVQHLLNWADALGLDAFDLVGTSFGALIAGLVYFERPDAVHRVVLVGSGSVFEPDEHLARGLERVEAATVSLNSASLAELRSYLAASMRPAATDALALGLLTAYAMPGSARYRLEAVRGMRDLTASSQFRILQRLEQFSPPTLVVWGKNDTVCWSHGEAGVKRMPAARLVVLEDCGHQPHLEASDRFTRLVIDFLQHAPKPEARR